MANGMMDTEATTATNGDLMRQANRQLQAAGVDTGKMASRAGEFAQMVKDEVAARPFQALAVAAALGFVCGLRR